MIALLVALSLGQADAGALDGGSLDAGAPVEQLYVQCADAPKAEEVDGGLFEPWPRVKRENCKMAACESFVNDKLTATEGSPGTVLALVGGGVAVAALAFIIGFVVPHPK